MVCSISPFQVKRVDIVQVRRRFGVVSPRRGRASEHVVPTTCRRTVRCGDCLGGRMVRCPVTPPPGGRTGRVNVDRPSVQRDRVDHRPTRGRCRRRGDRRPGARRRLTRRPPRRLRARRPRRAGVAARSRPVARFRTLAADVPTMSEMLDVVESSGSACTSTSRAVSLGALERLLLGVNGHGLGRATVVGIDAGRGRVVGRQRRAGRLSLMIRDRWSDPVAAAADADATIVHPCFDDARRVAAARETRGANASASAQLPIVSWNADSADAVRPSGAGVSAICCDDPAGCRLELSFEGCRGDASRLSWVTKSDREAEECCRPAPGCGLDAGRQRPEPQGGSGATPACPTFVIRCRTTGVASFIVVNGVLKYAQSRTCECLHTTNIVVGRPDGLIRRPSGSAGEDLVGVVGDHADRGVERRRGPSRSHRSAPGSRRAHQRV